MAEDPLDSILAEFAADWCECGQDCNVAAKLIQAARQDYKAALARIAQLEAALAQVQEVANV